MEADDEPASPETLAKFARSFLEPTTEFAEDWLGMLGSIEAIGNARIRLEPVARALVS